MHTKLLLCAALLTLGSATLARAQDPKPQDPKPAPARPADTAPGKVHSMALLKTSHVLGAKVENPKGEDLGKIEDVVVDPTSGTIDYAVLSFGGFLGLGDKLFALPWSLLRSAEMTEGRKDYRFVLNIEKSKLEKAPGFPKENWPDSPTWAADVDKYYGTTRNLDATKAIEESAQLRLFRLSKLIDRKIETSSGDNVGDIDEIVLDPRSGRVSYFVLSSGGFLGVKDRLYAIPWEGLKFQREKEKEQFVLMIPKEKFEKAPEFKSSDWDRMSDPVWVREVYVYYGYRPYWGPAEAGFEKPRDDDKKNDKDGR